MIADLDTLLTALYVELTDRIIPSRGFSRRGAGQAAPEVTGAELACLAVAQVLLRYDDELHWLRAAPKRIGHCGHSVITPKRSDLYGWAGYGYCPSHSRWYPHARQAVIRDG